MTMSARPIMAGLEKYKEFQYISAVSVDEVLDVPRVRHRVYAFSMMTLKITCMSKRSPLS